MSNKNIILKKFMSGALVTALTLIICAVCMLSPCRVSAEADNPKMKIICSNSEIEPGDVFSISYFLKGGSTEYISLEVRGLYGCDVIGMDFYGDDVIKCIDRDEYLEKVVIQYNYGSSDEYEHVADVWLRATEDLSADSVYLLAGGTFYNSNMQSAGSFLSRIEIEVKCTDLIETQRSENLVNSIGTENSLLNDRDAASDKNVSLKRWIKIILCALTFITVLWAIIVYAVTLSKRRNQATE